MDVPLYYKFTCFAKHQLWRQLVASRSIDEFKGGERFIPTHLDLCKHTMMTEENIEFHSILGVINKKIQNTDSIWIATNVYNYKYEWNSRFSSFIVCLYKCKCFGMDRSPPLNSSMERLATNCRHSLHTGWIQRQPPDNCILLDPTISAIYNTTMDFNQITVHICWRALDMCKYASCDNKPVVVCN